MSVTIDEFRYKLLKEIVESVSEQATKLLIDSTMEGLLAQQVSVTQMTQFLDVMIHDLGNKDLADSSKRQSANIRIARIHLNEIKLNRKFS